MATKLKTRKAPAADPIFARIEKHRAAHEHARSFSEADEDEHDFNDAVSREWDLC